MRTNAKIHAKERLNLHNHNKDNPKRNEPLKHAAAPKGISIEKLKQLFGHICVICKVVYKFFTDTSNDLQTLPKKSMQTFIIRQTG